MTMVRRAGAALAASALALAALTTLPAVAFAQDLYDCGDFDYQEDAQAVLDDDPSDPYRLDDLVPGEGDGVACESLPRRGGPVTTTPTTTTTTTTTTPTPTPTTSAPVDGTTRDEERSGDDTARAGGGGQPSTTAPSTTPSPAPAGDRDCPDFASQAEAQAVLDADPSDPERLDADDDGIACEQHFGDDSRQVQVVPRGGVDTGGRANDA